MQEADRREVARTLEEAETTWISRDGRTTKICDMDDQYLENAIKFSARKAIWKALASHCVSYPGGLSEHKQLCAIIQMLRTEDKLLRSGFVPLQFAQMCIEARKRDIDVQLLLDVSVVTSKLMLDDAKVAARLISKSLSEFIRDHINDFFR